MHHCNLSNDILIIVKLARSFAEACPRMSVGYAGVPPAYRTKLLGEWGNGENLRRSAPLLTFN